MNMPNQPPLEIRAALEAVLIAADQPVDPNLLAQAPEVPWKAIARMRDHLAHRYFDTDHAIVQDVVDHDLGPLAQAVQSLIERTTLAGDDT